VNSAQQASSDSVADRCRSVKDNLLCPHCGMKMNKWATPTDPFSDWDTDFLYICFNDDCPYFVNGWMTMTRQGRPGISYRLSYHPERDRCTAIPVGSSEALRGWIVE